MRNPTPPPPAAHPTPGPLPENIEAAIRNLDTELVGMEFPRVELLGMDELRVAIHNALDSAVAPFRVALAEAERCLSFVMRGEESSPHKWTIPGGSLRRDAIDRARALLAATKGGERA